MNKIIIRKDFQKKSKSVHFNSIEKNLRALSLTSMGKKNCTNNK